MFFVHDMGEIFQNEFLSFKEINILCYVYNFLNFVLLVVLAKFGMFDLVLRYEIDWNENIENAIKFWILARLSFK